MSGCCKETGIRFDGEVSVFYTQLLAWPVDNPVTESPTSLAFTKKLGTFVSTWRHSTAFSFLDILRRTDCHRHALLECVLVRCLHGRICLRGVTDLNLLTRRQDWRSELSEACRWNSSSSRCSIIELP